MRRVFGGAALIVAGIAAVIEAGGHAPEYGCPNGRVCFGERGLVHTGLSHTAYDLLRIGGWALLVFGVLLVVVGLIGYWRGTPR